jgi:hypothetical protein
MLWNSKKIQIKLEDLMSDQGLTLILIIKSHNPILFSGGDMDFIVWDTQETNIKNIGSSLRLPSNQTHD